VLRHAPPSVTAVWALASVKAAQRGSRGGRCYKGKVATLKAEQCGTIPWQVMEKWHGGERSKQAKRAFVQQKTAAYTCARRVNQ
jgi:hypothetical protein